MREREWKDRQKESRDGRKVDGDTDIQKKDVMGGLERDSQPASFNRHCDASRGDT